MIHMAGGEDSIHFLMDIRVRILQRLADFLQQKYMGAVWDSMIV